MDIKRLDSIAKENLPVDTGMNINDQFYYIAIRGLYSQYKNGEINLDQTKSEKEILTKWHKEGHEFAKQIVYLNKGKVVEAVIHELGRYISCATTNAEREKSYPRTLFEERIVKVIDAAYEVELA